MSDYNITTWSDELPNRTAAVFRDRVLRDTKELRTTLRNRPNEWACIFKANTSKQANAHRTRLNKNLGPLGFEVAVRNSFYVWMRYVGNHNGKS